MGKSTALNIYYGCQSFRSLVCLVLFGFVCFFLGRKEHGCEESAMLNAKDKIDQEERSQT